MPKILQRTLLISIISYLCYIFLYYIAFIITGIAINNKSGILENRYSAIFFFIITLNFYDIKFPDYIFIAPFSRNERILLQKKLFLYNHFATWIITSAVIVLPDLIISITNKNIYSLGKFLFITAVIYFLLFAAGHFKYFNLINRKNYKSTGLLTDIVILADSSAIAAITTDTDAGIFAHIITIVTGISAIIVALYCYKKHFKNMLVFYSDYELRIQYNNYKLFEQTGK